METKAQARCGDEQGVQVAQPSRRPIANDDTITVRLPSPMAGAIEAHALGSGKTKSAWLREALAPILSDASPGAA